MAETTGVWGGSSVLLASIGTSTFECSLVDCSGSLDVSHDGSFDDFCKLHRNQINLIIILIINYIIQFRIELNALF